MAVPFVTTFENLMRTALRENRLDELLRVFYGAQNIYSFVSVQSYDLVVEGFNQAGKPEIAEEWYQKAQDNGYQWPDQNYLML